MKPRPKIPRNRSDKTNPKRHKRPIKRRLQPEQCDTIVIDAEWSAIVVSHHAVVRYRDRIGNADKTPAVMAWEIRHSVMRAERSDRNPSILDELRDFVQYIHRDATRNRMPTVFWDRELEMVALVVRDADDSSKLAVLTVFGTGPDTSGSTSQWRAAPQLTGATL